MVVARRHHIIAERGMVDDQSERGRQNINMKAPDGIEKQPSDNLDHGQRYSGGVPGMERGQQHTFSRP